MGTNPRAANADLTGVYYDNTGDVACIVHADNDNFTPHAYAGITRVEVPYTEYAAAGPPLNFKGRAKYIALTKAIIARAQQQHPILAAIIQNRVDAFDAWFADVAAKKTAYDAAFTAFFNALTQTHKTAWNNISTLAGLATFVASLSASERAAYDAMVTSRQAYGDALQGGPNP